MGNPKSVARRCGCIGLAPMIDTVKCPKAAWRSVGKA